MKVKTDLTNLVITGKWNKYLLSPDWLAKHIFDKSEIKIEFSPTLDHPLRFTCDNIRIVPTEDRVIFIALEYSNGLLEKIEDMAYRLIDLLPFTPIAAFGTNFAYIEEGAGTDLLDIFELKDNNKLSDYDVTIEKYSIQRKLLIEGQKLNLDIIQDGGNVVFGFNFHYDAPTIDSIKDNIKGRFVENKKIAENLLNIVYELVLED